MENNFINGINGKYSFYVVSFDSENNYANYGKEYFDLNLSEAQDIYKKTVLSNPRHVNTMLGVAYVTDKAELDYNGKGTVDLLQCINGKIRLSQDYSESPLLKTEGLIAVNTVNILQRSIFQLQSNLDIAHKNHELCEIKEKAENKSPAAAERGKRSLLERLHKKQVQLNASGSNDYE